MSNKSFTLIEILVVIVIIGILSGFIIVSMAGVSQKATIAKGQAFASSLKNSMMLNLVSEWKLDDASGTTVTDYWDSNNGTWSGAGGGSYTAPSWRTSSECVSNGCLAFDATDDYVSCGTGSNLEFSGGNFTVGVWIKPTQISRNQNFVVRSSGTTNGWAFRAANSNYIYLTTGSVANGVHDVTSDSTIDNNAWQHVVVTYGTSVYFYKNGFKNTSRTRYEFDSVAAALTITGIDGWWGNIYFSGLMDDVRIYNQAIPASQVKEEYYSGLNRLLANKEMETKEFSLRLTELIGQND